MFFLRRKMILLGPCGGSPQSKRHSLPAPGIYADAFCFRCPEKALLTLGLRDRQEPSLCLRLRQRSFPEKLFAKHIAPPVETPLTDGIKKVPASDDEKRFFLMRPFIFSVASRSLHKNTARKLFPCVLISATLGALSFDADGPFRARAGRCFNSFSGWHS